MPEDATTAQTQSHSLYSSTGAVYSSILCHIPIDRAILISFSDLTQFW